jgi:hypothetical protein
MENCGSTFVNSKISNLLESIIEKIPTKYKFIVDEF